MIIFFFFFFSSRRRHTRLQGDWSSDVCSSDLFWLDRDEMADFDFVTLVAPVAREKLGDETAVALFGARFGAQKRDFRRPGRRVQARGNTAFLHDGEKTCFIRGPIFVSAITLEE